MYAKKRKLRKKNRIKNNNNLTTVFWATLPSVIIFLISTVWDRTKDHYQQKENNDNLVKIISLEIRRNYIALRPYAEQASELFSADKNSCNEIDVVTLQQLNFIMDRSQDLRYDVYNNYLDKFMYLDKNDAGYFMMYYTNLIAFKQKATAIKTATLDMTALVSDDKLYLRRAYCSQVLEFNHFSAKYIHKLQS